MATAAAVRGLGQQTEQSSNEMFGTAMYVQQLRNETWAKDEFVNQSMKLGELEDNFYKLKGADAVAAKPQYMKDIQNLYQTAIANSPNPQAGRFLGDALSRRISYSLVDAGRHAGQQEEVWQESTDQALGATTLQDIGRNPRDNARYEGNVSRLRGLAATQTGRLGKPGQAGVLGQKYTDEALTSRVDGVLFDPDGPAYAQKLLDDNKALPADSPMKISSEAAVKLQERIHTGTSYARQSEAEARRAEDLAVKSDANQIFAKNVSVDENGNVTINPNFIRQAAAIPSTHPGAENAETVSRTLTDWADAKRRQERVPINNSGVADRLSARLHDKDNPLTELDTLDAEKEALLGRPGIDPRLGGVLREAIKARDSGAFKDPAMKATLAAVKNRLETEGLQSGSLTAGMDTYARFEQEFYPSYIRLLNAGRGMANGALNLQDPNSVISTALEAARNGASLQERLRAAPPTPQATAPPSQRLPGETPAEWLARRTKATPVAMPEVPQSQ